nr:MAG TPA: hypothetical protein [Caudoviricetes sp.]
MYIPTSSTLINNKKKDIKMNKLYQSRSSRNSTPISIYFNKIRYY